MGKWKSPLNEVMFFGLAVLMGGVFLYIMLIISFTDSMAKKAENLMDVMSLLSDVEAFEQYLEKVRDGRELKFYDFTTVEALTAEDLQLLFDVATVFRVFVESSNKKMSLLRGKSILNVFFESSTRTRISFELGGKHLGADTINFAAKGSSSDKGETIGDTARTLNSMKTDLIICRNAEAGVPGIIASEVECPVINAGDGWHEHPTQALFDVHTIYQHFGRLEGVKLCIIGDILHSRVAGSLMRLANMLGMELIVCGPQTLIPDHIDQFTDQVHYNLDEIIDQVDVAYALRVQTERNALQYIPTVREYSKCYGINPDRAGRMKDDAIVMHPGPVMREVDVMTPVLESERSKIDDQVTNGFAMRMALMWLMIGNK